MLVASTELKTNLGKYLDMLDEEEIVITRNGRRYARIVREKDNAVSDVRSLFGILAGTEYANADDEEIKNAIREERSGRFDRAD